MSPSALDIPTAQLPQAVTERERQRRLMGAKRAYERDITIPPIANPRRRRRCSKDPELWLRTYMPQFFFHPFTSDQSEMVEVVMARIRYGAKKAHAAARGDGKTSIVQGCCTMAIAEGLLRFPLAIAKSQPAANRILHDIKKQFANNEHIAADYPEICAPIRALRGAPSRAGGMTVGGVSVEMSWSGDFLVFPTVPGSKASGVIMAAFGIESAFLGINCEGVRPDLVIIDDPESRKSARSPADIKHGVDTIDRAIAGLGGQDKSVAIVYLGTIITAECMAAIYTDRKQRPAWGGVRKRFMVSPPENMDLWEEYFRLRIADQLADDETGATAHKFYIANRRKMDAGAVMSNPHRYDKTARPGGGTIEISALQMAMNFICDNDWTSFNAEYQNIPPADEVAETDALDVPGVMRRLSGRPQGLCPPDTEYLVAGIDVHGRHIDWGLAAYKAAAGEIIDYGVDPVHSPMSGKLSDPENTVAVDDAIISALCEWRDRTAAGWPIDEPDPPDGPRRRGLDAVFIDARWRPDPVFAFVRAQQAAGDRRFRACMGFGTGQGQSGYRHPTKAGGGKKLYKSSHIHARRQPKRGAWLWHIHDDHWKGYVQDGFSVPAGKPGSLLLYGDDPVTHRHYARGIVAEKRRRRFVAGKGFIDDWVRMHRENHPLDFTKMAAAAAVAAGMVAITSPPAAKPDRSRPGPKIVTKTKTRPTKRRRRRISRRQAGR